MNKHWKTLAVLACSAGLLSSTSAMASVLPDTVPGPPVVKKLEKTEANAITPNTTFEFQITPASVAKNTKENNIPVYAGKDDLLKFTNGSTLSYSSAAALQQNLGVSVKGDLSGFTPGIYRYKIREIQGTVDGITYDSTVYTVDVYVTMESQGKKATVVLYKGQDKASGLVFKNTYTTHKLTIIKKITGNAADLNKKFKFKITIKGADGETYATNASNHQVLTSGTETEVILGNNESIEIYGLSAKDTYKVVEDKENYTSSGTVETATAIGNSDKMVTVTNKLETTIPTGVIQRVAPFAIALIGVGFVGVVYYRKKREEA